MLRLNWLLKTGVDNIWKVEQEHRKRLLEILNNYDFIHTIGASHSIPYVGIVSCLMDGISSDSAEIYSMNVAFLYVPD